MFTKKARRLIVAVLAVAMTLGLMSTAFASSSAVPTPKVGEPTATLSNTVGIQKAIVFVNEESTTVREPNISYTYTIEAVAFSGGATATVKDGHEISATVKAGVAAALGTTSSATIKYEDSNSFTATPEGNANVKNAEFTFDPTKFSEAGIYRYKITEALATGSSREAVGVAQASTYVDTRYLDVYVRNASDTDETKVIYGYVLFEDAANTSFDDFADPKVNIEKKSSGFVNASATAGSFEDVDVYETQNLKISKVTAGVFAQKSHEFQLNITLGRPNGVTAEVKMDFTGSLNATNYVTFGNLTGAVKNGSIITITGIPVNATIAFTEQNDTPDSYKVKIEQTGATDPLFAEAVVEAGQSTTAFTAVALTAKTEFTITNTLDAISPTGYVIRFAPYVLVLAGGIILLILCRKFFRRAEADGENA